MSSGPFTRTRYEASYASGAIHPIRVQPETLELAESGAPANVNDPPALDVTNPISAKVSGANTALGLRPRKLRIQAQDPPPADYEEGSIVSIPILTPTFYDAIPVNSEVVYLGTAWQVISKQPEVVR